MGNLGSWPEIFGNKVTSIGCAERLNAQSGCAIHIISTSKGFNSDFPGLDMGSTLDLPSARVYAHCTEYTNSGCSTD